MNRPDRVGVLIEGKSTCRITADGAVLLKKDLTVEELRATVVELANGLNTLHSTTLIALTDALGDKVPKDECLCAACNLMRLRDLLAAPVLH